MTQQVDQSDTATTTNLATSCMRTFVENQPFTMTAAVTGAAPTGTLSFVTQASVVLCGNVALVSGRASCTTNALVTPGSATTQVYGLSASYSGDAANAPSASAAIQVTALDAGDVVFRHGFQADSASCPIE